MYTLYLSLLIALAVIFLPMVFGVSAAWTTLPGVAAGIASFIWVNRRMAKRVQAVTAAADAEMAQVQQIAQRPGPNTVAAINHKFSNAIAILETGFVFHRWQIGVYTMLNARIGMLYFSQWLMNRNAPGGAKPKAEEGHLVAAIPYLERSRLTGRKAKLLKAMWPAWAMLAVAHYKGKKDLDRAVVVLEGACKVASDEGLLWSTYAWMLWKSGRLDEAIAVLARAKAAVKNDARVAENLTALQNKKDMKMKGYGEMWYQFGLETPKIAGAQPAMGHPRMRMKGAARAR